MGTCIVGDRSHCGRPSSSRNERMVKQGKQLMRGNQGMTTEVDTSVEYHEFVPAGQIVKGPSYVQVLRRLKEAIRKNFPAKKKRMVTARQQFSFSYIDYCADMTRRKEHSISPPASLLNEFITNGILALP
ncbi:hypothetical protein TNIN_292141 [Trichonephila inaurata madagascariensis]|uniref:Uncharacterized protein n=1 Tax=Trichonephila inaurata madagascariensis TaxID=2747483 RepID=A0A8X7C0A4_9ARAC|nr:hypothetical protein TNIN_292141 [Trichonephila inaurata madagascariensis]